MPHVESAILPAVGPTKKAARSRPLHRVLWAEYLHAAAIYERLYDALPAATDANGVKTSGSPAYRTAVERSQVLCDAALEARAAVLDMPPVTPEGFAADVAPKVAQPHRVADRIIRLLEFFGEKTLADLNGRLCRDYAKQSSTDSMAKRSHGYSAGL